MSIKFNDIAQVIELSSMRQNGDFFDEIISILNNGNITFNDSKDYNNLAYYCLKVYNTNIWGRSEYNEFAVQLLEEGLKINKDDSKVLLQLGSYFCYKGLYELALEYFEKTQNLSITYSSLHNTGVALFNLGRYEEASESFRQAHLNRPELDYNYLSYIYYAISLGYLGEVDKAISIGNEISELEFLDIDEIYEMDIAAIYYSCKEYLLVYNAISRFKYNYYLSGSYLAMYLDTLFSVNKIDEMKKCIEDAIEAEEEFKRNNLEDGNLSDSEKLDIIGDYNYTIKEHMDIYDSVLSNSHNIQLVVKLVHKDFLY